MVMIKKGCVKMKKKFVSVLLAVATFANIMLLPATYSYAGVYSPIGHAMSVGFTPAIS